MNDQSAGGVSAPQQIKLLSEKAALAVPTTVLEAQKLITQWLAANPGSPILPFALTVGSGAFKLENETFPGEVNKLKDELASRQSYEYTAKLAEFRRAYDSDVGALKGQLQKSENRADGLHACADLQCNSRTKDKESSEKTNAFLRA